ncbi:head GIN domain-containing protein [Saccharicrinis sp. FJH62]|uniref:head GIN domain-containing protein n=1 Tax=Saccharicrinis sp. FJH62 TaxID=3344657 RepID=UPI0035D4FFA3
MKKIIVSIIGLSVLLLTSCIGYYKADGPIETRDYALSDFEGVELDGSGDVFIYYGETFSVEVTTHSDLYDLLNNYVVDGVLHLGFKNEFRTISYDKLQYKITLPELHYVSIDGSGNIDVMDNFSVNNDFAMSIDGSGDIMTLKIAADRVFADLNGSGSITTTDIDCQIFDASLDGSGKIRSQGYARKQIINLDGSGDIITDYLETLESYVDINGSGTCKVWATDILNIRIDGSGKVYYYGEPEVTSRITGSGDIVHLYD